MEGSLHHQKQCSLAIQSLSCIIFYYKEKKSFPNATIKESSHCKSQTAEKLQVNASEIHKLLYVFQHRNVPKQITLKQFYW